MLDLNYESLGNIWKGLEGCFLFRLNQKNMKKLESLKAYTYKTLLYTAAKSGRMTFVSNFLASQDMLDFSSPMWSSLSSNRLMCTFSKMLSFTFCEGTRQTYVQSVFVKGLA